MLGSKQLPSELIVCQPEPYLVGQSVVDEVVVVWVEVMGWVVVVVVLV